MHYVKQFHINGVDTKQVACIELHGRPNAATEGYVGVLGIDMDSPLHEVYKCVAVNGSIYSWELLSSGMSVISSTITKDGVDKAEFPYDTLRTPAMYVVKVGDLILDREAYVYQIVSIHSTYCEAEYCDVQSFKGAPGKNAYEYAVDGGYAGTEADFIAELSYLSGLKANAQHQLDDKANIGEKISNETAAHVKSVPDTSAPYAKVLEIGGKTRKGTNFIQRPYKFERENTTIKGLTITVNNDGTIVINGTVDTSIAATAWLPIEEWEGDLGVSGSESFPGKGKTFTFSGAADGGGDQTYQVRFVGGGESPKAFYLNNSKDYAVCSDMTFCTINLLLRRGVTYNNVTFKPMLNEGTTALPYEPYFSGLRSVAVTEVESVGVNIFGGDALADRLVELGGTKDATNKTVTITAKAISNQVLFDRFNPNRRYVFAFEGYNTSGTISTNLGVYFSDGTSSFPTFTNGKFTMETDPGKTITKLIGVWNTGSTTLYYEKCGIFEATLPAEGFKPYTRHTLPIPAEVQALNGYGWGVNANYYNYIDWEKKQFVKRVGCVDLGTLEWGMATDQYVSTPLFRTAAYLPRRHATGIGTLLCEKYESAKNRVGLTDKKIAPYNDTTDNRLCVVDLDFSGAAAFKAAMAGVMLYYELAEPVVTDISDLLPADNYIGVEGGGTVTMVSEYGYDVPSKVNFYEDTNEIVGADTFVGNLAGTAARAEADAEGKPLASREWVLEQLAALVAQSEAANTP